VRAQHKSLDRTWRSALWATPAAAAPANASSIAGPPPLRSATGADLDQLEPEPLDQAVDPVQCSLVEEIASQQCVKLTMLRSRPGPEAPESGQDRIAETPPDADVLAEQGCCAVASVQSLAFGRVPR
jgi:hypothetical protein